MSRKRPASAVTCHDEGELVADLREWSFSCFMLVPVDEAGSPRKVPEDSGFSRTRRRIRMRIERTVGGRPGFFGRQVRAWRCLIRSRCHRSAVSGWTSNRSWRRNRRGMVTSRAARRARSSGANFTRSAPSCRSRTVIWWRRARIPRVPFSNASLQVVEGLVELIGAWDDAVGDCLAGVSGDEETALGPGCAPAPASGQGRRTSCPAAREHRAPSTARGSGALQASGPVVVRGVVLARYPDDAGQSYSP